MICLRFLGGAQEVTGSMHLLETDHGRLLIDCGLFQGHRAEARERNRHLPAEALTADAVLLTHAHIDHSGSLPTLCRSGFRGAIWSTAATRDLSTLMLRDAARIQESDARWLNRKFGADPSFPPVEPLYDEEDAVAAMSHFIGVPYGTSFSPLPGVSARFIEAGHILGSAQVVLDFSVGTERRRIVFTGDLGRRNLPILRDPEVPNAVDYLVMESTYGAKIHGSLGETHDRLERVIKATLDRKGKVIVPAFALGRTQELIYGLHQLYRAGRIPEIPVYIDSPLAIRVTEVFKLHPECFSSETRHFMEESGDPFSFRTLRYVETQEESMGLDTLDEPAVIISASGMCESGRVLHHLRNAISDERNTVLIVGFMAQHTLGRRLVERRAQVPIFGVPHDLYAQVVVLNGFSAHGDKNALREYALITRPKRRLFLVHGEPEQQGPLEEMLTREGILASAPSRGLCVQLD